MKPLFSDHCAVSFPLGDRKNSGQKSFKFFNHIAEHPDFIGVVRKGWRGMAELEEVRAATNAFDPIKWLYLSLDRLTLFT
ncbi:hypothetical protein H5410_046829 [Solanum commersonii]|uniref:Uncharacterized protein n=1 Tax=Solanum commersonii TaxID=4109 RepID=A0A9J5XDD2_SOLCO|nr:hypothetical protein H5410_046829 [Solanum commersonii]